MTAIDHLIPLPLLVQIDHVDLAVSPERAWERVRHGNLGTSPLIRALFAVRTLPNRIGGDGAPAVLQIDDLTSTPERPGFRVLVDDPPHEVALGAIGKVWEPEIPYVYLPDARAFAAFRVDGWVKVAWAVRVLPRGEQDSRVEIEVRVGATDEESWYRFRRYFRLIGPGSHLIRRSILSSLAQETGKPEEQEATRPLPGDELLPGAESVTHGITIAATPERIWPWLVQMGCGRAGFYSFDRLDNAGIPSARDIHPELQSLRVGDVIPARPEGEDGFEVLRLEPEKVLILGGLYDAAEKRRLPFAAHRPADYWHVTWAFVLEPLDAGTTRLHVRARAAFSEKGRFHASWIRPVHILMEAAQLRHLAARAEGRLHRDGADDVLEGLGGAAVMTLALLTPFMRGARNHWGLDQETAARTLPGDELVAEPRLAWTHGVEIDAPPDEVWPWIAQIGAHRGGFYSYQALENLVGCDLQNADRIHPEWEVRKGGLLVLHPKAPPLKVVALERGRYFVAHGAAEPGARAAGRPWAEASWLFLLEPLDGGKCRLISRFRSACSDDLATRLASGPTILEPVGFAMDRRMLLGVKSRAEQAARRTR